LCTPRERRIDHGTVSALSDRQQFGDEEEEGDPQRHEVTAEGEEDEVSPFRFPVDAQGGDQQGDGDRVNRDPESERNGCRLAPSHRGRAQLGLRQRREIAQGLELGRAGSSVLKNTVRTPKKSHAQMFLAWSHGQAEGKDGGSSSRALQGPRVALAQPAVLAGGAS
jgi:hypothetical protein